MIESKCIETLIMKCNNNYSDSSLLECIGIIKFCSDKVRRHYNGFLVAQDLVLTSASLFDGEDKSKIKAKQIQFLIIGHSTKKSLNYLVKEFRYHQAKNYKQKPIFLLLKLQQKIIRDLYIQLGYYNKIQKQNLSLIGFNTDDPNIYLFEQHHILPVTSQQENLEYELKDKVIMIGAPLLVKRGHKIISIGLNQVFDQSYQQYPIGNLFTQNITTNIVAWQKQMANDIKINLIQKVSTQHSKQYEPIVPIVPIMPVIPIASNKPNDVGFWDRTTQFAGKFKVQGYTIKRIQQFDEYSYQITSKQPIKRDLTQKFKITINKFGGKFPIVFALICESQKKERWSGGKKQSIGLWMSPEYKEGSIYVDGVQTTKYTKDLFINETSEFSMQINQQKSILKFIFPINNIFQYKLINKLKTNPLYISISMYQDDDQITITKII